MKISDRLRDFIGRKEIQNALAADDFETVFKEVDPEGFGVFHELADLFENAGIPKETYSDSLLGSQRLYLDNIGKQCILDGFNDPETDGDVLDYIGRKCIIVGGDIPYWEDEYSADENFQSAYWTVDFGHGDIIGGISGYSLRRI